MTGFAVPGEAQYLLRFDDLCPTMKRGAWERYLPLLHRYRIAPILGVIPDNQDPKFHSEAPHPKFWEEMRSLEAAGATTGLHGYQHLCNSVGWSLVPLHRHSEFAGAPMQFQQEWIRRGMAILRGHGLHPRVWVAPRHGFDRITLEVLQSEGMDVISDGFAYRPFRSRGLTWIPQQLWTPVAREAGLWTICLHPSMAGESAVGELESFLERFAAQFTSVERVLTEWPAGRRSLQDHAFFCKSILRIGASKVRGRLRFR